MLSLVGLFKHSKHRVAEKQILEFISFLHDI